jgi:hypothetical protein
MRILLTISFVFLLLSCELRDNKTAISEKPVKNSRTNRLDNWLEYYDLKLDSFTDSLPVEELKTISFDYDYLSGSENLFKDYFIFSPDSANFIDLDSYSIMLEKDSVGQLFSEGKEVDSEVALIDIKGKRRVRILFCGTDCRYEEAYWKKNGLVYILGFTKLNSLDYPFVWIFDIKNNSFQEIKTKLPIDLTGKEYVEKKRLKMITFKKQRP